MSATPFTDRRLIAGSLYGGADRLAGRTAALHAAKISGGDAVVTIAGLAADAAPDAAVLCDIGCGRGTTTVALAERLVPALLIALDQSPALLATVRARLGRIAELVCADFHHLPLRQASVDAAVAAFCLYHSPHPARVIAQIARCLVPGGHAVLVTKSADSYHEIDQMIAHAGLDPQAGSRLSLYETFHSAIAAEITATALRVEHVLDQRHVFRFTGPEHLAAYVATSPKYRLPRHVHGDAAALAAEFRRRMPNRPVTATSTVTYVIAARL